jgi:GNAT superfamily N-acetyltransferase
MSFLCTDPAYQGQGAGSLLTRKVTMMAAADGLPVYLESTEWAYKMYDKCGFHGLHGFQMDIPPSPVSKSTVYQELCMAWYPPRSEGLLDKIKTSVWRFRHLGRF